MKKRVVGCGWNKETASAQSDAERLLHFFPLIKREITGNIQ